MLVWCGLRHTVVTRLLEAGEPDHVVDSITGHQRYELCLGSTHLSSLTRSFQELSAARWSRLRHVVARHDMVQMARHELTRFRSVVNGHEDGLNVA